MVIEILSPSTESHDKKLKFNKYLKAGIREYWIIDPVIKSLTVYLLEEMYEITHVYTAAEKVSVQILPGCSIDLGEVLEE